ncbi:MAG: hypothetical protein K1W26_06760 [Acetatifactor sp.]
MKIHIYNARSKNMSVDEYLADRLINAIPETTLNRSISISNYPIATFKTLCTAPADGIGTGGKFWRLPENCAMYRRRISYYIALAWDSKDWTMKDMESHYKTLCRYLDFRDQE